MAADIIPHPGATNGGAVAAGGFEDRFALTVAPARPVLDAMAKLRKARDFLAGGGTLDALTDAELLALLPETEILQQAKELFRDAECVPAPEEFLYLAFSVMLAAAPNSGKVAVEYTIGLVDSVMHDEELHRGYDELGFSFAVVALAIRQLRRQCRFVPSAQEVLDACDTQRRSFRKLAFDVDVMISQRQHAEEAMNAPSKPVDDFSDVPF